MSDEKLAAAFGRFAALVQERARAGLAHPDRRGVDAALFDIEKAAGELIEQLAVEQLNEEGPYGHCDTCGELCDEAGCTLDREHVVALELEDPRPCMGCSYLALDAADLAEHQQLNHPGVTL